MLPIKIVGLGHYLPARVVTSAALEAQLNLPEGWIERVTGVRARRYVESETSVGMAVAAARHALASAACDLDAIDAIIGASAAPQQAIPCTAAFIQRELGAPEGRSACYDINATCMSFLVALQHAAALISTGIYRTMLVCSSEISTHSLNYAEPTSSVLFGDAAAAAVVTRAAPGDVSALHFSKLATYSSGVDLTRLVGGGTLHHPNNPQTTPQMNTFQMNGRAVYKQAAQLVGPFLEECFATLGWAPEDVAVIAHQASGHALDLLTERYGFRPAQIFSNLAERGNCIAASLPLAFSEAVAQGFVQRGQRVLLIGTGAGLTIGAAGLVF
ncbi:ketoacyl-ACP synthase III [Candidatus Gracilibacteria bacterium]|nr:ketoacyl-ACP synthase III [Candidatus Gracilibacteria bacterium]